MWLSEHVYAFVCLPARIFLWICLLAVGSVLNAYLISAPKLQDTCHLATKFRLAGWPPSLPPLCPGSFRPQGIILVFSALG